MTSPPAVLGNSIEIIKERPRRIKGENRMSLRQSYAQMIFKTNKEKEIGLLFPEYLPR